MARAPENLSSGPISESEWPSTGNAAPRRPVQGRAPRWRRYPDTPFGTHKRETYKRAISVNTKSPTITSPLSMMRNYSIQRNEGSTTTETDPPAIPCPSDRTQPHSTQHTLSLLILDVPRYIPLPHARTLRGTCCRSAFPGFQVPLELRSKERSATHHTTHTNASHRQANTDFLPRRRVTWALTTTTPRTRHRKGLLPSLPSL